MTPEERQRRHDERWQKEVLDGLARVLNVLHDVSDHVQRVAAELAKQRPATPVVAPEPELAQPLLLTVDALAELLGITSASVRNLLVGPTDLR